MQKSKADKAALLQSACTPGDPYHSLSAASESPSPGPGGVGSAGAGTYGSSSGLAGRFRSNHQTVANVPTPAPNPDAPRNNTVNPSTMIPSFSFNRDSLFFRVPRLPVFLPSLVLLCFFFFLLRTVYEVRHELDASPADPADHFQQLHHRISPVAWVAAWDNSMSCNCKCKKEWCQNGRGWRRAAAIRVHGMSGMGVKEVERPMLSRMYGVSQRLFFGTASEQIVPTLYYTGVFRPFYA